MLRIATVGHGTSVSSLTRPRKYKGVGSRSMAEAEDEEACQEGVSSGHAVAAAHTGCTRITCTRPSQSIIPAWMVARPRRPHL